MGGNVKAMIMRLMAVVLAGLLYATALPAMAEEATPEGEQPMAVELDTFEQQLDFFNAHWDSLKAALIQGGGAKAVEYIEGTFSDDVQLRVIYAFARTGMIYEDWEGKNLGDYITVCDAGIAACLRQAEAEEDKDAAKRRINAANVISYNLGTDLAFCWNDGFERTTEQLKRGVKAGDDCIRWRKELGNPPITLCMAYWLRGVHYLALEELDKALEDFTESLKYAEQTATDEGRDAMLDGGDGMVLLIHGWVELTRMAKGEAEAAKKYDYVVATFRAQLTDDDEMAREDAKWFLMQLENAERTLLGQ